MPVKELLATHSSLELRKYMAYERHAGPIGDGWQRDRLDQIHYLLQWNNYLLGAWVTQKGEENPVPQPVWVGWKEQPEEDEDESEEE